jgi:chromosome segregation ATPase
MAFAGLIFIGLLFGVILSGIAVGFIVIRAGGPIKESLFGAEGNRPAFGGKPQVPAPPAIESDSRVKAMQEEIKVMQRLIDQGRGEREQHQKEAKAAADSLAAARAQVAERDARIGALEAQLMTESGKAADLMMQLSDRTEQLSRVSLQLKDARLELDVSSSSSSDEVTSSQISELQRERDQLLVLVDQLKSARTASRSVA